MPYVATVNTPGYLPEDDDNAAFFDTPREAWEYLAEMRERDEDDAEPFEDGYPEYSETRDILAALGTEAHWFGGHATTEWLADNGLTPFGEGTVYGLTPGYDGQHDLGLAYSVTWIDGNDDVLELT